MQQTFGEELTLPEQAKEMPNKHLTAKEIDAEVKRCDKEMKKAAKELRFEDAAHFRDLLRHYQNLQLLEENPL